MFTSMFALEMLLKLLACGPLGYIRNPYNIFDGIIVVIRWVPSLASLEETTEDKNLSSQGSIGDSVQQPRGRGHWWSHSSHRHSRVCTGHLYPSQV